MRIKHHERVSLQEMIDVCQAKAISGKLLSTEETVYRGICREYSENFNTPLHVVMNDLDPEHVILTVFEHQLSDVDLEDDELLQMLVDRLNSIEDPDYESSKESDLQRFIDEAEAMEEDRLEQGLGIHRAKTKKKKKLPPIKKTVPKKEKPVEEKKTGGYLNLSYLEEMDKDEGGEF